MITSKDNQTIKYIKSLSQKKYRELNNEYVVEGIKMVKEALESKENISKLIICNDLINDELDTDNINLLIKNELDTDNINLLIKNELDTDNNLLIKDKLDTDNINLLIKDYKDVTEYVSSSVFKYISDTVTPQGILAIVKQKNVNCDYSNIVFALDNIQDPGNIGTIIRTLDAAGYKDLILSKDTAEVYNPKVVRSTMGAIFRVNLHKDIDLKSELITLKQKGYKVVVTALETEKYYYDLNFNEKLVIVIGNESKGVSFEIKELADEMVKIPMIGKTESLNAAVAASIICYEGVRRKFI